MKFSEELELTGSPLKLDLSLHTILDDTMITDEPQLWTKEEATHGPITLDIARLVHKFKIMIILIYKLYVGSF